MLAFYAIEIVSVDLMVLRSFFLVPLSAFWSYTFIYRVVAFVRLTNCILEVNLTKPENIFKLV